MKRNKKIIQKENKKIIEDKIPKILKSNKFIYFILFLIILLSSYIRIVIPWNATFSGGYTLLAMDDAPYHLRLVENLISNFPYRISYDPFTNFPFGSVLTWGYIFDLIIGTLALVFGVNNLNMIGAIIPGVLGVIIIIPIYFIGAELFNKKAGLFGAFIIAITPGVFLGRSMLGFTDHHVAEVLFSTLFIMYLIMAFNRVKYVPEKLTNIKSLKFILNTPLKYAVLSGIFLGLYILTWTTGILFAGIIAIFIILQIFINYYKKQSNDKLISITIIVYSIPAIMILPFVDLRNGFGVVFYSPTHIIVLISVILVALYLNWLTITSKRNVYTFIGMSILSILCMILFIAFVFPSMFTSTFGSLDVLFSAHTGWGLTIGEAQPTDMNTIYAMFGLNFILSVLGILILSVVYFTTKNSEKILIVLIWFLIMLTLLFAQNRWSYYFAINVAIMSGIFYGYFLDYFCKFKDIKNINIFNIVSLIIVIIFVGFYPFGNSPYEISVRSVENGIRGDGFYEWNDAMTWMRYNTPDTGLDYNGTYIRPKDGEKYSYPETAYGIMSWWDYGHLITYWGHRIPNSNPFQSGIGGGKTHEPGASTFFTAKTEEDANIVLDKLGVNGKPGAKYIVSNARMAYSILSILAEWNLDNVGYYQQLRTSRGNQILPAKKYYDVMESKLHIFDANGLKHYRLVHESVVNPYSDGGAQELLYKEVYNKLINPNDPILIENSGYIKIFEYVPGANILGKTTPNTEIYTELHILTNINRNILYTQKITSDIEGNYNFTVPYSTTGSIPEGTQFDTKPQGKYNIYNGDNPVLSVDVSENDVLRGNIINV